MVAGNFNNNALDVVGLTRDFQMNGLTQGIEVDFLGQNVGSDATATQEIGGISLTGNTFG